MRISDWSSDVCSSDLECLRRTIGMAITQCPLAQGEQRLALFWNIGKHDDTRVIEVTQNLRNGSHHPLMPIMTSDRKSVVSGKSVSVRVDLGGRRLIKKTKSTIKRTQIK